MNQLPRLSRKERLILELLEREGELFGLQLVAISARGLRRGTVYVTLGRMQEKGYLTSRQEALPEGAIGLPRRFYQLTGYATHVLSAWRLAEEMLRDARHQEA